MPDAPSAGAASLSFQYGEFVNKANCTLTMADSTDISGSSKQSKTAAVIYVILSMAYVCRATRANFSCKRQSKTVCRATRANFSCKRQSKTVCRATRANFSCKRQSKTVCRATRANFPCKKGTQMYWCRKMFLQTKLLVNNANTLCKTSNTSTSSDVLQKIV